jgi:hypothetical protein
MMNSVWLSAREMAIAELRQMKLVKKAKEREIQLEALKRENPDAPTYELEQYVQYESVSIDLNSDEDGQSNFKEETTFEQVIGSRPKPENLFELTVSLESQQPPADE